MPSGRTCFLQTVWLIFVFCVITDWLIDWFLVFNATFSNISAISWWGVITENTCILIRSHILLSYEPKITPLFFPTQESCSGLYFYIQSTNRRNRGKIDTPKTNIHGTWPLAFLANSIPLRPIYMAARFLGFIKALQ